MCLDGTGNQFKEDNSNVVKLFRVIQRGASAQLAYYDPGVGTLADPDYKTPFAKHANKVLGLAFGRGLTRNVEEAYSFLMGRYQDQDRVFIFGFSRGAYTARVLAGFLHACGLLESGCQNLIPYAMKLYTSDKVDFPTMTKFKSTYGRSVDIHFLGLWDAVSTFGWIYDPVFLPYTTNNPSVKAVRHAIAIDERRSFFKNMPWGDEHRTVQDVKETWFAGVHSDVGGGYPESESGLSKVTLKWMIDEASNNKFGLAIEQSKYDRYVLGKSGGGYIGPDSSAHAHESLKGAWRLIQGLPRRVWSTNEKRGVLRMPDPHRNIAKGSVLHHSVLDRISNIGYSPATLKGRSVAEIRASFAIDGP